jgi:hypothetical protein
VHAAQRGAYGPHSSAAVPGVWFEYLIGFAKAYRGPRNARRRDLERHVADVRREGAAAVHHNPLCTKSSFSHHDAQVRAPLMLTIPTLPQANWSSCSFQRQQFCVSR